MSGCLIAFLIFLSLSVLGAVGGGIYVYSQFGEFIGAGSEMASLMLKSQSGPGTDEMRDAGCDEAIALDMEKLADAMGRFEDEIARREGRASKRTDFDVDAAQVVACRVTLGDAPTCKEVAKAYLKGASPTGNVLVTVEKGGTSQCSELYDDDGKRIGDAAPVTLPSQ